MKAAGIDFCERCHSESLFDTQDENGKFITVCNDCGMIQEPIKYRKITLTGNRMVEIDTKTGKRIR